MGRKPSHSPRICVTAPDSGGRAQRGGLLQRLRPAHQAVHRVHRQLQAGEVRLARPPGIDRRTAVGRRRGVGLRIHLRAQLGQHLIRPQVAESVQLQPTGEFGQELPGWPGQARRRRCGRKALPVQLPVHESPGRFEIGGRGQDHVRVTKHPGGGPGIQGKNKSGLGERRLRSCDTVEFRLNAHQNQAARRLLLHQPRVHAGRVSPVAWRAGKRKHAGQTQTRGVAALGDPASNNLRRQARCHFEQLRAGGMAHRDSAEPHGAMLAAQGIGGVAGQVGRPVPRARHDGLFDWMQVLPFGQIQIADPRSRQRGLANPMRQNRRLAAQIAAHHQQGIERFHVSEAHAQPRRRRFLLLAAKIAPPQPVINAGGSQRMHQLRKQMAFLAGGGRRNQRAQRLTALLPGALRESLCGGVKRLVPAGFDQPPVAPHQRFLKPVFHVQSFATEAVPIRDPGLVHRLVVARHDAPYPAPQYVSVQGGTHTVMRRHRGMGGHFPGARRKAVGLVVQRPHGTHVDHVARQLVLQRTLDEGGDFHVLAAARGPQFLDPGDFLAETNAARAVNAAGHVGGNQRTQVGIADGALGLRKARDIAAEAHRQILQFALPALVANRTIQRMIDQQELHGGPLGGNGPLRMRFNLHAIRYRSGASRQRFGRAVHVHQAHPAIGRHAQLGVIAKARNVDARPVGGGNQHFAGRACDFAAVYTKTHCFLRHRQPRAGSRWSESSLRILRGNA